MFIKTKGCKSFEFIDYFFPRFIIKLFLLHYLIRFIIELFFFYSLPSYSILHLAYSDDPLSVVHNHWLPSHYLTSPNILKILYLNKKLINNTISNKMTSDVFYGSNLSAKFKLKIINLGLCGLDDRVKMVFLSHKNGTLKIHWGRRKTSGSDHPQVL